MPKTPTRRNVDPEVAAKVAMRRRAKPSAVPGHVRPALTLDLPRELAQRLSARSIRERKNLEGVVVEMLKDGA